MLAAVAGQVDVVMVRAPSVTSIDTGTPPAIVEAVPTGSPTSCREHPCAMVATLAASSDSRWDAAALGVVGLPLSPTVHRDDDRTVMENLLGLRASRSRTAIDAVGGRPVRVGPVTLATVNGPWPAGAAGTLGLPPQVDVRQPSLFLAAWTVGALASFVVSGAQSMTLYETTGWRGIMEREAGSATPADACQFRVASTPYGTCSRTWQRSETGHR